MKRKSGNHKLWSVPRISDPRWPGIVVRITELKHDGPLYLARQLNGKPRYVLIEPKVTHVSLGENEKQRQREATALALHEIERIAAHHEETPTVSTVVETVGQLLDRYDVDGLHGCTPRYRTEQLARVRRVVTFLGREKSVAAIKPSDIRKYLVTRTAQVAGHAELVALSIACNWAAGEELIDVNPLSREAAKRAMKIMRNPQRPAVTKEQYDAIKTAAKSLPPMFGVLLTVAWETGHRFSAIQELRWRDVDLTATKDHPHGQITWYAGCRPTKKRREHTVELNREAQSVLAWWQQQTRGIGAAFVFPAPEDATKSVDYHLAQHWMRKAETRAELPHLKQGGWHALRRGWATARKHLPIQDVAEAGGWWDTATPAGIYQQPDRETRRAVATYVA